MFTFPVLGKSPVSTTCILPLVGISHICVKREGEREREREREGERERERGAGERRERAV